MTASRSVFLPRFALFAVFVAVSGCASSPSSPPPSESHAGLAIHPQPKEPKLIAADLLPEFKRGLVTPPAPGSEAQARDEEILFRLQSKRTAADCERANAEVYVSLQTLFGKPYGPLADAEVAKMKDFFDQVRNDADYYIQLLKKEFPRQRPFLYLKELNPCVPREVTGAYPSGHATLARLYALVLADRFPAKRATLFERADVVANDRVLSGMHHPSDIAAGKQLGDAVYRKLKQSPKFRAELKKL